MAVKNGRLVLPDGMSYRLLVLSDTRTMTPALLGKIKELVEAGATVVGPPPLRAPGLTGYPQCDDEVKRLAAELWGDCDGKTVREHRFGQGRVVWGVSPETCLARLGVPPDFNSRPRLRYIHRVVGDMDIYFVANPQARAVSASAVFRVSGRTPELWWPDTGRMERAAIYEEKDGSTHVALSLEPTGSVFVVFREPAARRDSLVSGQRDGVILWSAATGQRLPIVVEKAVYGIRGDAQRTRDVRARVQQLVDSGERSFTVARMAEGDDPAPLSVKTLVVEYTLGGQRFTVAGQDTESVHLNGEVVNVAVTKALYGVLDDPKRTRDVRALAQRIADSGEGSFQVARMAAGDDPAFGIVKTLALEYIQGGKTITVSATDPETIDFAMPTPETGPVAEMRCDAEGRTVLEATQAGRYELKTVSGRTRTVTVPALPASFELAGPWEVAFDPKWGGPAAPVTFEKLADWSKRPEEGVRYYSGTATYRTRFNWKPNPKLETRNSKRYLDLGGVAIMAEVKLNGKDLGLLWKPPFRVDATDALKTGDNALEVRVVNLWINRMIGDEQLPEDSQRNPDGTLKTWPQWLAEGKPSPTGRFTFTSWRLWKKNDALVPSGLLGPVTLQPVQRVAIR